MNRIQTACYSLIASAAVLAGLILVQLDGPAGTAMASEAIKHNNLSIVTAQIRSGEEGLFVLDSTTGRLIIYRLESARQRFELIASGDIGELFTRGAGGGEAPRRGR